MIHKLRKKSEYIYWARLFSGSWSGIGNSRRSGSWSWSGEIPKSESWSANLSSSGSGSDSNSWSLSQEKTNYEN